MKINFNSVLIALLAIFTLSGCLHRELVISSPNSQTTRTAPQAQAQPGNYPSTQAQPNANTPVISSISPIGTTTPVVTTVSAPAVAVSGGKIKRMPFPAQEYAALATTGQGTVKGTIYVTDVYGKKVYGTNTKLFLNPVTSYSREWYSRSYIGGQSMEKADKRLYNYLKFTQSNSRGQFAFFGIPSGSYYVIGTVNIDGKSVRIAKLVTVDNGSTVTVDLGKMKN